jgi:hypothetical protein
MVVLPRPFAVIEDSATLFEKEHRHPLGRVSDKKT